MQALGLPSYDSLPGSTNLNPSVKMMPPNANRRKSRMRPTHPFPPFFRLLFIFACLNETIFTVASHNLHGLKKSSAFHRQCIEKYNGIWMGQEIWLPENRLSELSVLGVQFAAHSGMEKAVSSGIFRGRPFGGVSIAWSPDLDHVIKPLINYRHKRIVCVEAAAEPHPLLFASVYMPYFDASDRNVRQKRLRQSRCSKRSFQTTLITRS